LRAAATRGAPTTERVGLRHGKAPSTGHRRRRLLSAAVEAALRPKVDLQPVDHLRRDRDSPSASSSCWEAPPPDDWRPRSNALAPTPSRSCSSGSAHSAASASRATSTSTRAGRSGRGAPSRQRSPKVPGASCSRSTWAAATSAPRPSPWPHRPPQRRGTRHARRAGRSTTRRVRAAHP